MITVAKFERIPGFPHAFGYGRQSDPDAINRGEGIPNQGERIQRYFTAFLENEGVKWGAFIPDESAVSARTNPFMLRHAGKMLIDLLQPGDYFIIDKIDRLWRSMEDFVDLMKQFKKQEITLCIVNMMGVGSIKLGTPMGDMFMHIAIAFAQLESDQASDRTRASYRAKRAAGRFSGAANAAIGTKLIGKVKKSGGKVEDTRQYVWDEDIRRFMGEIVRLADEEGKTAIEISRMIKTHFRQLMGEEFFRETIVGKRGKAWDAHMIIKYYWREKQYRVLPKFNPNSIRFEIFNVPRDCAIRDIGRAEPDSPNPYPFLDGRPTPTLEELYKIGG